MMTFKLCLTIISIVSVVTARNVFHNTDLYSDFSDRITLDSKNYNMNINWDNDLTSKRCTACSSVMSALGSYVNNRSESVRIKSNI